MNHMHQSREIAIQTLGLRDQPGTPELLELLVREVGDLRQRIAARRTLAETDRAPSGNFPIRNAIRWLRTATYTIGSRWAPEQQKAALGAADEAQALIDAGLEGTIHDLWMLERLKLAWGHYKAAQGSGFDQEVQALKHLRDEIALVFGAGRPE